MRDQAQGGDPQFKEVLHGLDPRNPEGRENLAGVAGGLALTYATSGLSTTPGVLAWLTRALGPMIGAGTAGATEAAVEQTAGTAPKDDWAVVKAGGKQAAYEAFGQAFMWLPRHIGKIAEGTKLGRQMKTFFETQKADLRTEMREGTDAVRDAGAAGVAAARDQGRTLLEDVKKAGVQSLRAAHAKSAEELAAAEATGATEIAGAKSQATRQVAGAKSAAEEFVTAVKGATRETASEAAARAEGRLADLELQTTADLANANAAYEAILKQPPSVTAAGEATRDVLAGLPPINIGTVGPAKKALDLAGQRVTDAANQPGSFDSTPIRDALMNMVREAYPQAVMPRPKQAGFGTLTGVRANQGAIGGATAADMTKLQQAIQKALGAPEGQEVAHPIKGVLERVIGLPKQLAFADAQALKQLLDEAVNFDAASKKVLERMTKGVRKTLRDSMSQIPGYDAATSNYSRLAKLYRKGVGAKLIKDAADNPDRVAQILKPDQPQNAAKIRDLLVTQSAEGGDPDAGLRAWNAIRSAYTYSDVFQGGVKDLSKRVHALVETQPEFAQVVFGDDVGKQILSNLDKIGMAYTEAAARGIEQRTQAEAIAAASQAEISEVGRVAEAGAKQSGQSAIEMAKSHGQGVVESATAAAVQRTAAVQAAGAAEQTALKDATAGEKSKAVASARALLDRAKGLKTDAVRKAIRGYMDRKEGLQAQETAFKDSSLGRFANSRAAEQATADFMRMVMPRTINKSLAFVRFLEGPTAKDLLYYSALSDKGTEFVVNALLNRLPDRAVAAWAREMLPFAVGQPVPSHEPVTKQ
jgi:hypothetical protein